MALLGLLALTTAGLSTLMVATGLLAVRQRMGLMALLGSGAFLLLGLRGWAALLAGLGLIQDPWSSGVGDLALDAGVMLLFIAALSRG